jgi:hypothetical protein
MLRKAFFTLLLGVQAASGTPKSFIPTSDAIEVAEKVAIGEGYSLADRKKFFFDMMPDKNGKPLFPGYLTVGFYWNSDIVSAISISDETGQVLDIDKCTVFDYPSLQSFGRDVRRGTGASPLSLDELSKKFGCDSMKRLTAPRKTP